jgi:hypothetical protein
MRHQFTEGQVRGIVSALDSAGVEVIEVAPGHVRVVRELVVDAITPAQLRQLGSSAAKIGHRIDEWNTARGANANGR